MVKHNRIKFNCDYCGKEAEQTVSNYNRYNIHFCNNFCRNSFKHWDKNRTENIDVSKKQVLGYI